MLAGQSGLICANPCLNLADMRDDCDDISAPSGGARGIMPDMSAEKASWQMNDSDVSKAPK